jgi:hypothetical protein
MVCVASGGKMTDSSDLNSPLESAQPNNVTSVSGGVNLDAERIDIGGDVVGRDKIETTNIYVTLNSASALGADAPAAVGKGLLVLRELMQRSAAVRSDASAFQADFCAAREQIDVLGDYKDLHDLLHRMQFHCYNGIVQAALRFPADDAIDNLTDYALTLDSIAAELQQVLARSALPKQEISWVEDVVAARTDLTAALDGLDEKLLKKVIWRLNRLLTTQPTLINKSLNQTARVLRLPALTEALARICERLGTLELDASKVGQFETGVQALRQLDHGLTILVDDHDRWQTLDLELRRIEGTLDHDLFDLEMSWPDVKTHGEPLFGNLADDWAQALQKESRGLDDALAASNPAKIKRGFRNFQRRVSERFFQIDVNLKAVCGNLRQIGTPLVSVLGMIE